ncbi:hypothetical protein ACGFYU_10430 [Streptomyces sp. NPDC048337]|uniref:hypothetical protein n=1 Tax=Streptomyces sp. NPDC048337 TaxID=3365535 RepID=UPI00371453C4
MVTAWSRSGGRSIRPSAGRLAVVALALLILGFLCPHNSEPGSPTSASPVVAGSPVGEEHHGPSHDCAPLSPQAAAVADAPKPLTAPALRPQSLLPGHSPAPARVQPHSECPGPAHPAVRAVLQV